jgi:DegV family protein with EDD domain
MLARLRVNLPDRTGSLARIATAVGNANADIESVTVLQGHEGGRAVDELTVDVVDSRSIGMGMGHGVITAAKLAAAGSTAREAAEAALRRSLNASIFMYVDTLEYLRRGGRIGAAQAWLGSALTIKPLLNLVDGRLEPLDRVRTSERAIARLVEVAVAEAQSGPVDVAGLL